MNSLFAASIFAGLVAATAGMAQTNTGPSAPQVTPVPGTTGTDQVNPPADTVKPSPENKSGVTELQKGASGSSSGASGTSGPYNPTPSPGTGPAPQ